MPPPLGPIIMINQSKTNHFLLLTLFAIIYVQKLQTSISLLCFGMAALACYTQIEDETRMKLGTKDRGAMVESTKPVRFE